MSAIAIGDPAPDFTLEGTGGPFTLSEHHGEIVVLLFYPGDETMVCTKQFCSYRDTGLEGLKLSRFDKVLGLTRERINRIYRGQPVSRFALNVSS